MGRSRAWAWCGFAAAGLWHRRGVGLMVMLTAALATGAAAGAFCYRDAARTSGLRTRLVAAAPADSGVVVGAAGTPRYQPAPSLDADVPRLPLASRRIVGEAIDGSIPTHDGLDQLVSLYTSTGLCAQLRIVTGRCPTGGHDIAVPVSVAAANHWHVGQRLSVGSLSREPDGAIDTDVLGSVVYQSSRPPPPVLRPVQVDVVGTYAVTQPAAAYWMGSPPVTTTSPEQALSTTLVATPDIFNAMPHFSVATVFVAMPLRAAVVTPAEVPVLRRALGRITSANAAYPVTVNTALGSLLRADAADQRTLSNVTLVAVSQLLALLGLVLVVVISVCLTARRTETTAAALAGRRAASVAAEIAVEPALLVVAGGVAGTLLAPVVVRLAVARWLRAGTPVPSLPRAGLHGVAAVVAAGVVAALLLALRTALRSAALAVTEPRSRAAWWEIAVFTIAVGGIVELLTAGGVRSHATPWALVAPSVCGLAVALLLARGLPPALSPLVTRTRRTPRLGRYLLVRELRRDAVAWRVTAVVAMAVSLLAFAVAVDRGAVVDRHQRAGLIVGADRVITVDTTAAALPGIVDRLDPRGQWAMGAVDISPSGSAQERTLAVQSSRLAAVAGWTRPVAGRSPAGLASLLHPTPVAPFRFTGTDLALPVTNDSSGPVAVTLEPLRLRYALPSGQRRAVSSGPVRLGRHLSHWSTPRCVLGCRLLSIGVQHPPRGQVLDMTIGGLGSGPWSGDNTTTQVGPAGIRVTADQLNAIYGAERLVRDEHPVPIPVAAAGRGIMVTGLDSGQPSVAIAARAAALPRLLATGSIVDLSYLALADQGLDAGFTQLQSQVWLGDRAPPDAVARLAAMHVRVVSVETRAAAQARLGELDPALGLDAYVAVAALAVLLALALLCGQGAVAARRRRLEYVALATAGVSRLSLGCGWFGAAAVRLAFSVGAGAATGLITARLAASGVPLAAPRTVPQPVLTVQTWPAVVAALATLVPLLAAEAFSVRWSVRLVGLRRARESAA